MQWIRIQLSQKKKRKATGQHRKQKDRGRPPGGRRTAAPLVIHFENFPKKAPKNRRLRRAFKSKQTHNIFLKRQRAHLNNFMCINKKAFEL